jgi:hypothetical protein
LYERQKNVELNYNFSENLFKRTKEVPLSQTVSENIHKLRKVIKSDERITLKKYRNTPLYENHTRSYYALLLVTDLYNR